MKQLRIIIALFLGTIAFVSCKEKEPQTTDEVYAITADRQSVADIAADSPSDEIVVITTDAPYWMITASPAWVKANPTTAEGNGKSTIVTFTIESNNSKVERSGEVVFVGGKSSLTIPFTQLGKVVAPTNDHYASGAGTEADPWIISSAKQLAYIEEDMSEDSYFKLSDDIDLAGVEWTPVNSLEPYALVINLDGGGKTIKNLGAPLFYDLNGTVKNLNITGAKVTAKTNAGVLARMISIGATVRNVKVSDSEVTADETNGAGGIVGKIMAKADLDNVSVSNCTITTAGSYPGGLVGWVEMPEDATVNIAKSSVIGGTVKAATYYAGGLVGGNASAVGTLNVTNCYATCNVVAETEGNGRWAGGILGGHTKAGITNLENCYATGSVKALRWGAGGIVGQVGATGCSVVRCMAYNSKIEATNTGSRYGSGAIVGSCVKIDIVVDKCYRSNSVVFDCPNTENTTLFDMEFISTPAQLPLMGTENTNAYYHHGKATDSKLSALVQNTGLVGEAWSSTVWDFSSDYPTLK